MCYLIQIAVFAACTLHVSTLKSYNGYHILKVDVTSEASKRHVRDLTNQLGYQPDLLGETHSDNHTAHFLFSGEEAHRVKRHLDSRNVYYTSNKIEETGYATRKRRDVNEQLTYDDVSTRYLTFDEQLQFIDKVAASSNLVKIQDIGTSYRGRVIRTVRIGNDSPDKPIVWIDAGTHAREWITYNVALYLIQQLVSNDKYNDILKRVTVVVAPNVNPDGYEHSRTRDRMWRKTLSRFNNVRCLGADPNRNYPFFWGTEGASHASCTEIYCGARPQSEPEVAALVNAIQNEEHRIRGYVALHSYGQEILYPWGHKSHAYPPDVEDLRRVGNLMADAIRSFKNTTYSVVNSGDGLYPAAGASDDWAKSRGIKYCYTVELSPFLDEIGFSLPEKDIADVNKEAFAALLTLIYEVDKDPGTIVNTSSVSTDLSRRAIYKRTGRTRSHGYTEK